MFQCESCDQPAVACCICAFPLPFVCEAHLGEHPDTARLKHYHLPLYARKRVHSESLRRFWRQQIFDLSKNQFEAAGDFMAIAGAYSSEFRQMQKQFALAKSVCGEMKKRLQRESHKNEKIATAMQFIQQEAVRITDQCKRLREENEYFQENAFIPIRVETSGGTVTAVLARVTERIQSLKRRVCGQTSMQRLSYEGCEMEEDRDLAFYRVPNQGVLTLESVFQIFVKRTGERTLVLDVTAHDSIATVKDQIQRRERIPPGWQSLKYCGKFLRDELTLSDCAIERNSTLYLSCVWGSDSIFLFVKPTAGKMFAVRCEACDTVSSLARRVATRLQLAHGLQLVSGQCRLPGRKTLLGCGLAGHCSPSRQVPVRLKTACGTIKHITLHEQDGAAEVSLYEVLPYKQARRCGQVLNEQFILANFDCTKELDVEVSEE